MKTAVLLPLAALVSLAAERNLATRYQAEHAQRVSVETTLKMETTAMEMLRDGEPVGGGRGFGGGGSSETYRGVWVDRWMECADGAPLRVQRAFETVEGERVRGFGGEDRSTAVDSPFSGVTLELSVDEDGEVAVEVVDGSAPEDEALAAHAPRLCLDGLLPEDPVEEGDAWDLEPEAIRRVLGLDVQAGMYPPPEFEGRGGEGRGGGRRGGRMGFGGGSLTEQLAGAAWSGKARLREGLADEGGLSCAVIEVELEAEQDLDGEGVSGSVSARLEGLLFVAVEARRPVLLELEGQVASEMDMEREREGTVMEIHRESEGTYVYRVRVEDAPYETE